MSFMQFILASRYLGGRKLRTVLTTFAIVMGVMVIFGMNSMLPAFMQALRQNMMSAVAQVDLTVSSATGGTFSERAAEKVRGIDGVVAATGILRVPALLPKGAAVNSVIVFGVEPESTQIIHNYQLADGRFLEEGDKGAMVITRHFAELAKLSPGDTFSVPSAEGTADFEIVGIIEALDLPGSDSVYITLEDAQATFNQAGLINSIEASYKAGIDRDALSASIASKLGDRYQMGEVDALRTLQANLKLGEVIINIFGLAALVMGGFIIFITFRTIVYERRRDIGMLRAVGASRGTIVSTMLAESLIQGIVGTLIGLAAGYGFVLGVMNILAPAFEDFIRVGDLTPQFSVSTAIFASVMGIGITVLGSLLPSIAASRISPLEALRPMIGEVAERAASKSGIAGGILIIVSLLTLLSGNIGLAALGFALFIVGLLLAAPAIIRPITAVFGGLLTMIFAREGQLAQGNVSRQPGRAAVTASVMMIGLAILVALAGMITSLSDGFLGYLDRSLGSDFILLPDSIVLGGANVAAGPKLAEAIREIDGISAVTTIRVTGSTLGEIGIQVVGIDPDTYVEVSGLQFSAGDPQQAFEQVGMGNAVIVNGVFAATNQVTVGDTITLKTPEGDRDYQIAGIASDYLNAKIGTAYMSQARMAEDFHVTNDVLLMANVDPSANMADVTAHMEKLVSGYPAFSLYSAERLRKSQEDIFKQTFSLFYVLGTALAVPSLVALLNTLTISVIERTREIGMIRAVGATKNQIQRIILAESLLLSATGTAFGILGGIWLSYLMVQGMNYAGFVLPFYFPASGALVALAVGMLFGVTAAILPARQAAKLQITQALRYE